jgi:hypothetical protein
MRNKIIVTSALSASILGWMTVATLPAQPLDKRAFFTFSAPVEVPGVVLPAGKYIFRVVDAATGGKVVQVVSADGVQSHAMFFTIPAVRLTPAEEPEIRFMETAEGAAPAVRTWWNPGETIGREFIYPKEQARRLARDASNPVLTTRQGTNTAAQTDTDDLARIASTGRESATRATDKPIASAPTGRAQQGQAAPASITITIKPLDDADQAGRPR